MVGFHLAVFEKIQIRMASISAARDVLAAKKAKKTAMSQSRMEHARQSLGANSLKQPAQSPPPVHSTKKRRSDPTLEPSRLLKLTEVFAHCF